MNNDELNGSEIGYSEPDKMNTSVEESDAVPGDEKEKKSTEEVTELENEKIDEMMVEGAVDGTQHKEEHRDDITEKPNTEEKPADKVILDGEIDASKCNGKEENTKEFINEGCTEDNTTVEAGEKVVAEVRNEEKVALNFWHDKEESATMEDAEKIREAPSNTELNVGEALVVSESDVKENSMMENMINQDLVEVKGFTEFPVDALTGNAKEERKDNEANIAGKVEIAPKKKVKKSKIVKKKKSERKGVVAEDESKSQLLEIHEPIVELRTNENVENEENHHVNPGDKVNKSRRVRKKKKKKNARQFSEILARKHETEPEPSENNKPAGKENVDHKEEAKSEGNVKKSNKRKRSQKEAAKGNAGGVSAEDKDKAGPSTKHKSSKKVETMGMIFMCSSKTKKDCFHYKIFGLPASKKDMVLKIYEGMRLFLFDFESRLLYGIYKAAGPGGYNIEPKAFNSGFPSQVRFTVWNECLPLPEEKFKTVIKDNYFSKNKFDCQLNPDQVKKLCKLFVATSKKGTKSAGKIPRVGTLPISEQQKKRKRAEDDADQETKKKRDQGDAKQDRKKQRAQYDAKRDRKKRRVQGDVQRDRKTRRAKDDGRRSAHTRRSPRTVSRGNPQPLVVYEREAYVPEAVPTVSYVALPPAVPAYGLSYAYGRTSGVDIYRQDTATEREDRRLTYSGLQYLDDGRSDNYRYTSYAYRDPGYRTSTRQEYYPCTASHEEYVPSSSRTSYYQVPLPPFRRY